MNVKVEGSHGQTAAGTAEAIQDVINDHIEKRRSGINTNGAVWRGSVINLSLGGKVYSTAEHTQLQRAASLGIPVITSAGNDNEDASREYPCALGSEQALSVICVGGMDQYYRKAPFSNFGSNLALAAPAVGIAGPGHRSDQAETVSSGTSYAVPHVSALMALFVSYESLNRGFNSYQVAKNRLVSNSYRGSMTGWPSNTELIRLANSGIRHFNKPENWLPVSTLGTVDGID